jgi:hypothetical protein
MRKIAKNWATPAMGYLSAVIGVIAIASLSILTLHGMSAKAQRHWDADIDRIVAKQQAKKRGIVVASLARTETTGSANSSQSARVVAPGNTTIAAGPMSKDESTVRNEDTLQPKIQNPSGRKYNRRADGRRQQHYLPAVFISLPKFATTTVATTLSKRR